jgi:hypothetical protein
MTCAKELNLTDPDSKNYKGPLTSLSGWNANPMHDFSAEEGEALDTNENGEPGETFYMKLPAYDGDYLAGTENGVVVECPECVPRCDVGRLDTMQPSYVCLQSSTFASQV